MLRTLPAKNRVCWLSAWKTPPNCWRFHDNLNQIHFLDCSVLHESRRQSLPLPYSPLRAHVFFRISRNQVQENNPHLNKTNLTLRFVKLQSKEDTLYLPLKSPDYWAVRKRVSSFQNLLDFWGRKRTNQFWIVLDCLIQEQSYLRPIVCGHVCLIRSNLICRRRAPVWCWW